MEEGRTQVIREMTARLGIGLPNKGLPSPTCPAAARNESVKQGQAGLGVPGHGH